MKKYAVLQIAMPFMLAVGCVAVHADNIGQERARKLAMEYFESSAQTQTAKLFSATKAAGEAVLESSVARPGNDGCYYYIFSCKGCPGFVIVSGDDRFPAYIAYSSTSRIDPANLGEGTEWFLSQTRKMMDMTGSVPYSSPQTSDAALPEKCDPLLGNIRWDQYSPYNKMTPIVQGAKTPVGCVATAVATVMRYYEWPTQATGTVSGGKVGTIDLDKEGTYDFALMPENLGGYASDEQTREKQENMVAKFCLHTGVALNMDYEISGSGAPTDKVIPAMVENFKYGKQARHILRNRYSAEEFENELKQSIVAGCPVVMAGYNDTYGHSFVIDGYDEAGLFHVDWGWSGKSNGYYNLDLLNAYDPYAGGSSFSNNLQAVVGIAPDRDGTSQVSPKAVSVRNYGLTMEVDATGDFYIGEYSIWCRMESDYADRNTPIRAGLAAVPVGGGKPVFGELWYDHKEWLGGDAGFSLVDMMPRGKYFTHLADGTYDILPAMIVGTQSESLMPFVGGEKRGIRVVVSQGGTHWETIEMPQEKADIRYVEGSEGYMFDNWDGRFVSFALQNVGQKDWSGTVGIKSVIYAGGAVHGEKEIGTALASVRAGEKSQIEVEIGGLDGYEYPDIEPMLVFTDANGKEQRIALTNGRVSASGRRSYHSVTLETEGEGSIEQTSGDDISKQVPYRSKVAFGLTPASGYEVATMLVNGVPSDPSQPVTIYCNTVVKAVFKKTGEMGTAITQPQTVSETSGGVYSIDGAYLGENITKDLPKGVYIIGGKKVVVK